MYTCTCLDVIRVAAHESNPSGCEARKVHDHECRDNVHIDVRRSVGKRSIAEEALRWKVGSRMPVRAGKSPFSWDIQDPRLPDVGSYSQHYGNLGARKHVSRLTTTPGEYREWQRQQLEASPSAWHAALHRMDVQASGSHLGNELRQRQLHEHHEGVSSVSTRKLAKGSYSTGIEPLLQTRLKPRQQAAALKC